MKILEEKKKSTEEILTYRKSFDYDTLNMTYDEIVTMLIKNELVFDPDQPSFNVWPDPVKSRYIEQILIEMPNTEAFMFYKHKDGTLEIMDGNKRIRTLLEFVRNDFPLTELSILMASEGFSYDDLEESIKRKLYISTSFRVVIVESKD